MLDVCKGNPMEAPALLIYELSVAGICAYFLINNDAIN